MAFFGLLIVILVVLSVPVLIEYNPDPATFNYYFGTYEAPLSMELLAAFALGFLACMLILLPLYFKAGLRARKLAKAQKKAAVTTEK